MKCLILASGQGTRLAHVGDSKPLIPVLGVPLIERVMLTGYKGGITEFFVVIGHNGEKVRLFLNRLSEREGIRITCIANEEWQKDTGITVLKAQPYLRERFILLMADHLFEARILTAIQQQPLSAGELILAVDYNMRNNPYVDLEDVTRVEAAGGRIVNIGKEIARYNAFDTGIFLCSPEIFETLENTTRSGENSLNAGVMRLSRKGAVRTFDIGNSWWIDVDDEKAIRKAEQLLRLHIV